MIRPETERSTATPTRDPVLPKAAVASAVLGWGCLCGALLVLQRSRPISFSYDRFFGVDSRRRIWDEVGVDRALWLILAALALSVIALVLSGRRPADSAVPTPWGALLLAGGAIAAFLAHLLLFG